MVFMGLPAAVELLQIPRRSLLECSDFLGIAERFSSSPGALVFEWVNTVDAQHPGFPGLLTNFCEADVARRANAYDTR